MEDKSLNITKSSGETVMFSIDKLKVSLIRTGADKQTVDQIVKKVISELYQGITTKEIYNRAFSILRKKKSYFASKYKLKKAIYELGPTGFPFERFIAAVFNYSGYKTEVGVIMHGNCVKHEIDVVASKNGETTIVECKFHSEEGRNCNVKVPLYIAARFNDVKTNWDSKSQHNNLSEGWVVTNTRFTSDAMIYGTCIGLKLLSWDYPKDDALKDRIDRLGLYPITVSTMLTNREKQFLLSRDVVLCRSLIKDKYYLDHLGINDKRQVKILNEIKLLCNN